ISLGNIFGSESLRVNQVAGATSFIHVLGHAGNSPIIQASGAGTNIAMRPLPKGAGLLRIGTDSVPATTPANCTADRYLQIKDNSGTIYYIPLRASAW